MALSEPRSTPLSHSPSTVKRRNSGSSSRPLATTLSPSSPLHRLTTGRGSSISSIPRRTLIRGAGIAVVLLLILPLVNLGSRSSSESYDEKQRKTDFEVRREEVREQWWKAGMSNWIPWSPPGDTYDTNDATGDTWVNFDEELPLTTYDGGLPGYQVFSNLYVSGSTLLAITSSDPDKDVLDEYDPELDDAGGDLPSSSTATFGSQRKAFPEDKLIFSKKNSGDEEKWRVVDEGIGSEEVGKRGIKLGGVTYIFNDGPGGDGYLVYFRHFVLEAFLGATRALASTLPSSLQLSVPRRVWFPQCGQEPSWRDDRGENAWFLAHTLPFATVEDASGWADRNTAGLTVLLEKVVIVDRWASHASSDSEVRKWNKMNAAVPSVPARQNFWDPFRTNMIKSLGADGPSDTGSRGLPVVVYVDRQKLNPKIKEADHDALVEALKGLTDIAEIHVARLSAMTKARQVELMGRAQIIIGLHGDELMTSLWMPATDGSTVVEIFEEGGFARDYGLLASILNHKYVAVTKNGELKEAEWQSMKATTGEERKTGEISVDAATVISIIRGILGEGFRKSSGDTE